MRKKIIQAVKDNSIPFLEMDDLVSLITVIEDEKYVLLGESSHGTAEFYKIRTEISKRLIIEKGFTFIAVEGDWPACQQINGYIKGFDEKYTSAVQVLRSFNRWPTWMWANEELIDLIEWLKEYNQKKPDNQKIGFYGLDVYSLWESMEEIIHYLDNTNPSGLNAVRKAFSCFELFNRRPEQYGVSAAFYSEGCHDEVVKLLTEISMNKHKYTDSKESDLNLEVNAIITANAENYYRTMITNDNESWNIRDRHMVEVVNKISEYYKGKGKGIIWEHNTHVGDAKATNMADEGIVNVGQILREQEGNDAIYIVGFGTHRGTVIAADEWGVNFERMIVPPAVEDSWEDLLHKAGPYDKILLFNEENRFILNERIPHRAIGVVYDPKFEQFGNYVPSVLPKRYDAFIYVNSTNALTPLKVEKVLL